MVTETLNGSGQLLWNAVDGDFVGMKCRFLLFNTEDVFTQVLEFTVQFEGPIILENAPSLE